MANGEIQNSLGQKRVQCTYSEQDVKQNNTYHYV